MAEYSVKDFERVSFPALYRCADDASRSGQGLYVAWLAVNLSLLLIAAIAGSINLNDIDHRRVAHVIIAVVFFAATGTTILLATRRWERLWYAGRAVAESAKSLTWKFVCGAEPFSPNLTPKDAVCRFTDALQELLKENKQLASALSCSDTTADQVTPVMLKWRASATGVRRDVYVSQRVNEQQVWYANKAAANRKHRNVWFAALVIFQASAGAMAVILAVDPTFSWRATAIFSTLASGTVAWGQMKRYQELAQAYGLAAQELSLISARAPYINTSEELARFVNDAETAISREHSMWVARRETK